MTKQIKNNNSSNIETNLYGVLIILSFVLMYNVGCSTVEYEERDMEEYQKHYEFCEPFFSLGDSETYMNCMMNPEIRSRLTTTQVPTNETYTVTNGNTNSTTSS